MHTAHVECENGSYTGNNRNLVVPFQDNSESTLAI